MQKGLILGAGVLLAAAGGCDPHQKAWVDRGERNERMVTAHQDAMIRGGILAERTVYPHHFVVNAAELNEVGRRDVAVLAEHYREHPGPLRLRRGEASEELYEARVQTVRRRLAEAGVVMGLVDISDALPAGRGMEAQRAIRALEAETEPLRDEQQRPMTFSASGGAGGGGR